MSVLPALNMHDLDRYSKTSQCATRFGGDVDLLSYTTFSHLNHLCLLVVLCCQHLVENHPRFSLPPLPYICYSSHLTFHTLLCRYPFNWLVRPSQESSSRARMTLSRLWRWFLHSWGVFSQSHLWSKEVLLARELTASKCALLFALVPYSRRRMQPRLLVTRLPSYGTICCAWWSEVIRRHLRGSSLSMGLCVTIMALPTMKTFHRWVSEQHAQILIIFWLCSLACLFVCL